MCVPTRVFALESVPTFALRGSSHACRPAVALMRGRSDQGWRVEMVDNWDPTSDAVQFETADEPMGTKEKFWARFPDGRE